MEPSDAPDRIQLQIVLAGRKKTKESVRIVRKTRDHEKCVYEQEDFPFKRGRRATQRPAAAPAKPTAAQAQESDAAADEVTAVQAGSLEQLAAPDTAAAVEEEQAAADIDMLPADGEQRPEQQLADEQPPVENDQQQQQQRVRAALAPLGPLHFSMAASELAYLVQWALASELRLEGSSGSSAAAGGSSNAAARIEAVAQAAGDRISTVLLDHSNSAAGGTAAADQQGQGEVAMGGGEVEPATLALAPARVLPFQVARLKTRLAQKRDWLLRVEQAWDDVEARYSGAPMGPTEQAPGDEAGTQEGAIAAPGQTAQDGSKEQPGGNDDGDAAEQGADEGAADPAMEKPEAAEGGEEGLLLPVEGSASAARAVAAARMELQVEEMEALVSKVELVAAEAEAAATALQAQFHRTRFCVYPHVNSPAVLIKSLIRAGGANAGGIGDAAVDG